MTSICRRCSEELTFSLVKTLLQSLWYITASGANVLFYCWVVFKIYFAILLKIVAVNNIQQSIKQAKQKLKNFRAFAQLLVRHVTHPGHLLLAHGCMEETF